MSACCPSSSSSSAPALRRPKGLWKARGTGPARAASHTPENKSYTHKSLFADHFAFDHDDDEDSDDSAASARKRRRLPSESPPTSDDEVLYWDYSRKCSPHPERLDKWTTRTKLMDTSSTAGPGKPENPPSGESVDVEDWEDLKELFAKAAEIYETQSPAETLPLLRGVIHECHRFMLLYYDPSILYATPPQPEKPPPAAAPPGRHMVRDWLADRPPLYPPPGTSTAKEKISQGQQTLRAEEKEKKCKCKDLATAFYTILGTTLFFFGTLIEQDARLAMPGEPDTAMPYWFAALDVFEIGENLPIRTSGRGCQNAPEDWRMAIVWGRALVAIAHENLRRQHDQPSAASPAASSVPSTPATTPGGLGGFGDYGFPGVVQAMPTAGASGSTDEPNWPPNSPFGLIAARRPPMTTRSTIMTASPNELLMMAQDHFSRGILHMPHPLHLQRSRQQAKAAHIAAASSYIPPSFSSTPLMRAYGTSSISSSFVSTQDLSPSTPDSTAASTPSNLQQPPETFSRAKELFTIASDVLVVAEKLDTPDERQTWAAYADTVFSQMGMELADMSAWRGQITSSRGRCQLVVGTAGVEALEARIEAGDPTVWDCEAAVDARDALGLAVGFFEKAREALVAQQEEGAEGGRAGAEAEIVVDEDGDDEDGDAEQGMSILEAAASLVRDEEAEREEEIAELGKLLGEALLDLANLTQDKKEQEALYARALKVSGDAIELDEEDDEENRMDEGF